ncbi:MAG: alkylation response protein AidB-like acyl-CoA dehydrogenase [Zhongshania sp.]|jgi:alkylation response protein AidB-like acyl-CoA dehydrogenase
MFNNVVRWAQQLELPTGGKLIDEPWVQINLAKVRTGVEALKLVCYKQAWAMTEGTLEMADASAAKVYGSEFFIEVYRLLGEVIGEASLISRRTEGANPLASRIERLYRTASIITFGGGTNEIQRDIISAAGLWMPRASR